MKKSLLIFIAFSILNKNKAQVVFCPAGAEWHHTFVWNQDWSIENVVSKYSGDTIIGMDHLKILSANKFYKRQNCKGPSATFIKQKGDTIFMNNDKTQNTWQILYNYAALPGQSWQTTFKDAINNIVTYTITVDSVSTVSINNFVLKRLYVKYCTNGWLSPYCESTSITERYGCDAYLFNYNTVDCASDADKFLGFLCYSDNAFGLKQFTNKSCDYTDAVGIEEFKNLSGIKFFPNPTSNILNLQFENRSETNYEIRLINILGKEILSQQKIKSEGENFVLDLNTVEQGIYFVQVFEKEKLIATEKVVKE